MSNSITHAQALETEGNLNAAVQAYDSILNTTDEISTLALANFRLGTIYRTWRELFTAQRFLAKAHQLSPSDTDIRDANEALNLHFSENREVIADEMTRKNSDQIVSLFRIATGLNSYLWTNPFKPTRYSKAAPKSFQTPAIAKHLLTDIQITEEERKLSD